MYTSPSLMLPCVRWPWLLTVPLLWAGFGFSLFFNGTASPLYGPALLPVLIAGLVLGITGFRRGNLPSLTATLALMALYWIYLFISLLWSTAPFNSTLFFFIFSLPPWLLFTHATFPNPLQAGRIHSTALLAALCALALWVMIQFLFLEDRAGTNIHHPLISSNNMAAMMNLGLLPAVALFLAISDRRHARLALIPVALFLAALLATQSRGGLLGAVMALAVLVPLLSRGRRWRILDLALVATAVTAFMFFSSLKTRGTGLRKLTNTEDLVSIIDRGATWHSTWEMIKDHPFAGTGLATFFFHYPHYRLPVDRSLGYFAHMDPLQFWAEMGFMAPLLFYAVLICILLRTIRAMGAARKQVILRAEILGPFCALLAVALHTHVDFHLYMPCVLIVLGCYLAYWYGATIAALPRKEQIVLPTGRKTAVAVAVTLFLCFVSAIWITRAALGIYYAGTAARHLEGDRLDKAEMALEKADLLAPAGYHLVPQYRARLIREILQDKDAKIDTERKKVLLEEGLGLIDRTAKRNSGIMFLYGERAKLYMTDAAAELIPGANAIAIKNLEQAVGYDPTYFEGRLLLAQTYRRAGELKKALSTLEEGLRWPRPRGQMDINYLVAIARLRLQTGDRAGHDLLIQEAGRRAKKYGLVKTLN